MDASATTALATLLGAVVVEIAERFARKIVDTYSEPNKSFIELREMINSSSVNPMREFSTACREEFEMMRIVGVTFT